MKKIFMVAMIGIVCVSASGCQGEPEPLDVVSSAAKKPSSTAKTVINDAFGALGGFEAGAEIGALFGPWGAIYGSFIGATICGLGASVESGRATVGSGPAQVLDPNNPKNPQEAIGKAHNIGLDHTIAVWDDGTGCGCTPHPYVFRPWLRPVLMEYAETFGMPEEILLAPELELAWYETMDFVGKVDGAENVGAVLDGQVESGRLTQAERDVMTSWALAVAPLDPAGIIDVTRELEDQVLIDPGLTEQERAALLAALSTGRHSAAYWGAQDADPDSPWRVCQDD